MHLSTMKKGLQLTFVFLLLYTIVKSQVVVDLVQKNGVYEIPCKVNGAPLNFIFDTGAADVLLSKEAAINLFSSGKIKSTDFLNLTKKYQVASGDIVESRVIYIRELEINGLVLYDVVASISGSIGAPLLLGQSALERFGEYSFNYNSRKLVIKPDASVDINQQISEYKSKQKNAGATLDDFWFQSQLKVERKKREINRSMTFDVYKINAFKGASSKTVMIEFDLTNNSNHDFSFIGMGFIYVVFEVVTEDGKKYNTQIQLRDVVAGGTIAKNMAAVTIRDSPAKYFRLYPKSAPLWGE
jgi:clan AA aspartic protease (TIGR02281 family)